MTTFVAMVETGGSASAARKLDLSPPVATRAVAEFESRLGLQLRSRTTRIVRVTEAGALPAAVAAARRQLPVEGLGIARVLGYQVAALLRTGALVPVLAAVETADLPIHLLHHGGRRATQREHGFIGRVDDCLRTDPSLG